MKAIILAAGLGSRLRHLTLDRPKAMLEIDGRSLDYVTERLLRLPMRYFETRRSGDIERRVNGMRQVRMVLVESGVVSGGAQYQLEWGEGSRKLLLSDLRIVMEDLALARRRDRSPPATW